AQAAHIPVHLGSMAYAMSSIVREVEWAPGDMLLVNDPSLGGTHLPDVTLIAPLFDAATTTPIAFVANRAHHADIGCPRPGSMPWSSTLADEGLVISPSKWIVAGREDETLLARLRAGLRNPEATLADFTAQRSANLRGLERLDALARTLAGRDLRGGFDEVNDYAAAMAARALARLAPGRYVAEDVLDGDARTAGPVTLRAALDVDARALRVDFTGSSAQVDSNVNCPLSVTAAAVYYVLHCLMPPGTPACAGSLRPVSLHAPAGSVINARPPAAVAAGNVETSQRLVDVLLKALAPAAPGLLPAASAGTMNNVAMGATGPGRAWDYYETIGGGGGASSRGPGLDARHTHMTNTLNTPVEIFESNYPARIARYGVRRGSGGAGLHRGGDGIVREYEFLAPAAVTLLTDRREYAPWGSAGGEDGACGRNSLNERPLPGRVEIDVVAGDRLRIETPGGGGWGRAQAATVDEARGRAAK
ncbi:MAG: hydantoinase B/oxoprolinase family protein, partial [Gammaproteobacteria bacterium]